MSQPTSLPEMPASVAVLPPPPPKHSQQPVQPQQQPPLYHHDDPSHAPHLVNISSSPARLPIFYPQHTTPNNAPANNIATSGAPARQNNEYLADELAIHFAESPVRSFANLEIHQPVTIDPVVVPSHNHHHQNAPQHPNQNHNGFRNVMAESTIPDIQLVANQQNLKNNSNGNGMNRKSIPTLQHNQMRKNDATRNNNVANNASANNINMGRRDQGQSPNGVQINGNNRTPQGLSQLPSHHFQNSASPAMNINVSVGAGYSPSSSSAGNLLQQRIHPPPVTTRHLSAKRPKLLPTNPIRPNPVRQHQAQHQAHNNLNINHNLNSNTANNNNPNINHRTSKHFTNSLPYSLGMSPQDAASAAAARFAFSGAQAANTQPQHQYQKQKNGNISTMNTHTQQTQNNFGIASPPLPQPSYRYSFPLIASQNANNNISNPARGLYLPSDKVHQSHVSLDYHHAANAPQDQVALPNINIANSSANVLDEKLLAAAGIPTIHHPPIPTIPTIPTIPAIPAIPGTNNNINIMRSNSQASTPSNVNGNTAKYNTGTRNSNGIVRTKLACPHETCGKEYTRSHALNVHISTKHTGTNQEYQCTKCGKKFNRKDTLKRHFATTHQMLRNWPCKQCSRRFGQQAHLNTHVRTVHGKDRPHACDQCPKSFGTLYNLNAHKNTHRRIQKAYACEVCRKTYKIKSSLARHKRKEKHLSPADLAAMNNPNNEIPNHQIDNAIIDNVNGNNTFRNSSTSSITDPNTNHGRRYYQPHQAIHDPQSNTNNNIQHQNHNQQQTQTQAHHQLQQSNHVSATSRRNQ